MDSVRFVISGNDDVLSMYIINTSAAEILVNKKFSLGQFGNGGKVDLAFTDSAGLKRTLAVKINYGKEDESNFFPLTPNAFIGKEISYEDLIEFYDLEPGSYMVQGVYKNNSGRDKGVFTGRVDASPIRIEIKPKKQN